jgi:chromosome segregation ATPase
MEADSGDLQERIFALEQKLANVRRKTAEMQASPIASRSESSSLGSSLNLSPGSLFQRTDDDGPKRTDNSYRGVGRYDRDVGDLAQSKESEDFQDQAYEATFSPMAVKAYEAPLTYTFSPQDVEWRKQVDSLQSQLTSQQQLNKALESRYRTEIDRIKSDAAKYLVQKDDQIKALEEALQRVADPESEVAKLNDEKVYLEDRLKNAKGELHRTKTTLEDVRGELMDIKALFKQIRGSDPQKTSQRTVKALELQVRELETEVKTERSSNIEAEKRYKAQVQSLDRDLRAALESVRKAEAEGKQLQRQLVHVSREHQREVMELQESLHELRSAKAASQQVSEQRVYTLEMNELKRELQGTQKRLQDLLDENLYLKSNQKQVEVTRPAKRPRPKTTEASDQWSPSQEAESAMSSKLESVATIERELMCLQQDKQRLEAELGRMPEYPKTIDGKKKKAKVEYDIKVIDTNVAEAKRQLRAMK